MTLPLMEELLFAMAGHPTSFFVVTSTSGAQPWSWTLRTALPSSNLLGEEDHKQDVHPGLNSVLDALAEMAARYRRIRTFAISVQDEARRHVLLMARDRSKASGRQNPMLPRLAACMLALLEAYEKLIQETESDIMHGTWDMVTPDTMLAAGAAVTSPADLIVSVTSLRARFEQWRAPLYALDTLVSQLLHGQTNTPTNSSIDTVFIGTENMNVPGPPPPCPRWKSGPLLDLLMRSKESSVGQAHECMSKLLRTAEDVWRQGLVAWMCYGTPRVDMDTDAGSADESLVEWAGNLDPAAQAESLSASVMASSHLPSVAFAQNEEDDLIHRGAGWRFVPQALPSWIVTDNGTSNAILHAGRALARVREHSLRSTSSVTWHSGGTTPSHGLPTALTASHIRLLQSDEARPCSRQFSFAKAVRLICDEVAEWMWRRILTPDVVLDAFDTLGGYFLHRKGLFITTLLERLADMRKHKLVSARSAAASVIQVTDIELAIQRALIDVEADDDQQSHLLDHCSVSMPSSRSNAKRFQDDWKETGQESGPSAIHFDDIAIGAPFTLRYRAPFPLDMILTPLELRAYSNLFSYLLALQAVRARLRDGWASLSKAQRSRRRFTGIGEGGDTQQEARRRKYLLRIACGVAREGTWFLDVLAGHFQTDIIDVQYDLLLERLQTLRPVVEAKLVREPAPPSSASAINSSVDGWRQKVEQTVRRVSSMRMLLEEDEIEQPDDTDEARSSTGIETSNRHLASRMTLARKSLANLQQERISAGAASVASSNRLDTVGGASAVIPSTHPPAQSSVGLDFATTRKTHQAFLSYVLEGLLLTNAEACQCVWRILQTCLRFTALLDRWGGDVLPELLSDSVGDETLSERASQMTDVSTALRRHLDAFFMILSKASESESSIGALAGEQRQEKNPSTASPRNEAQSAATRHHEQLLLRLDFNRFISQRFTAANGDVEKEDVP